MKSNKSRKAELRQKKEKQIEKRTRREAAQSVTGLVQVNKEAVVLTNFIGIPEFYKRGYYLDEAFICKDCGSDEQWTATQQKWWFEVIKARTDTMAVRCKACRRRRRESIALNNIRTEEGLRKKAEKAAAKKGSN
jgi:hypothetical protein